MGSRIIHSFKRAAALARRSAPYVLLEILLPGGTLFALLLFIYQQRHLLATEKPQALHVVVAEAPVLQHHPLGLVACRCSPSPASMCCASAANDNDAALCRAA